MSREWTDSGRSEERDESGVLPDITDTCNYHRCRGETTFVAFGEPADHVYRCEACGKEHTEATYEYDPSQDPRKNPTPPLIE